MLAVLNINHYLCSKILIKRGQRTFTFNLPSVKDLSKIHNYGVNRITASFQQLSS